MLNQSSICRIERCISSSRKIGRHYDPLSINRYSNYNLAIWQQPIHSRERFVRGAHWFRDDNGLVRQDVVKLEYRRVFMTKP